MKLSERLQAAADAPYDMTDIMGRAELLAEAAALARRVERADRVKVIETGGTLIATATPAVVRAKAGDTLLLVPVEGGA